MYANTVVCQSMCCHSVIRKDCQDALILSRRNRKTLTYDVSISFSIRLSLDTSAFRWCLSVRCVIASLLRGDLSTSEAANVVVTRPPLAGLAFGMSAGALLPRSSRS